MNRSDVCDKFLDTLAYDLYPYQEEALLAWFESDAGVLITAPTGMGKTLIAEAAVFEALSTGQRLYYTTPLIALTDQKFREFQQNAERWGFPRDHIGLITGNRRVNPDAPVRVVVAEILLNHLLANDPILGDVQAVVMDEFHSFNDFDRGVVWELSLLLLPKHIRLMLLSATVGNSAEFVGWLSREHGRTLRLIQSDQRRVPLEFIWIEDKLLTEHLPSMVSDDDSENRAPALVFCFNREECWEIAEKLKGLKLINPATREQVEEFIAHVDFSQGIGPKLRHMLISGVGVHHAGILPRYKEVIEELFLRKLIPFVICTETLAAGINLPARSVVVSTLLKGKRGDKKLIPSSAAHQMFGRAGRPQFDKNGYVYSLAHEDDVKIHKWRKKYDQIDQKSKDPGILRIKKDLERKKPTRRKTEQHWTEGQFRTLIAAGPARLASRSMIPYQVLIFLIQREGAVGAIRELLSKRFNTSERLEAFQTQLDHMIGNLAAFGYLTKSETDDHVTLHENIRELMNFRSIDPVYGVYLGGHLARGSFQEKLQVLESVLPLPPVMERLIRLPDLDPGPLQQLVVEPLLIQMGIALVSEEGGLVAVEEDEYEDYWAPEENEKRKLSLPEMLKLLYDAKLKTPEDTFLQPKWVAGGIFEMEKDFYKYVRARDLIKNEGLVLRHLLRLIILAGEFQTQSGGDPEYEQIGELATSVCRTIDPSYTDRFLASEDEARKLTAV